MLQATADVLVFDGFLGFSSTGLLRHFVKNATLNPKSRSSRSFGLKSAYLQQTVESYPPSNKLELI